MKYYFIKYKKFKNDNLVNFSEIEFVIVLCFIAIFFFFSLLDHFEIYTYGQIIKENNYFIILIMSLMKYLGLIHFLVKFIWNIFCIINLQLLKKGDPDCFLALFSISINLIKFLCIIILFCLYIYLIDVNTVICKKDLFIAIETFNHLERETLHLIDSIEYKKPF